MSTKILLIEDEKNFALVLKDYLQMNGFTVTLCENGEEGLRTFKSQLFDLCLLDVMMPEKDGYTVAQEIRKTNIELPIIFLTARGRREDQIKGYRLGADDYMVKPFDSEILLFKIRAVLSRKLFQNVNNQEVFEIGSFAYDSRFRTLKQNLSETKLSPKENELLLYLCRQSNQVVPRSTLLKSIWKDDNYFTGRSMDVYIAKLRKYLAADPTVEITNLHGNGYCLRTKNQQSS